MPRRPEIGNIQLYPNRPLKNTDRNGYVLKFYCPLRQTRIRRNTGTRDRREARRILRECRERLFNGDYLSSGGAITATSAVGRTVATGASCAPGGTAAPAHDWDECVARYRQHRTSRVRKSSLEHAVSRLNIAERIFMARQADYNLPEGLLVSDVLTLDMLEYLQDRLLAGDECRHDQRSPNTVNSMMGAVMAFVRFCHGRGWVSAVPAVEKLEVTSVMKGRPVTTEEFERMLDATAGVVGEEVAPSWRFALKVLWESGFRVGDLMDFSWDDERHIHPVWPARAGHHPTILIPATQKNGRTQEIPLLPGLDSLLLEVPRDRRVGWIVNPQLARPQRGTTEDSFQPTEADLRRFVASFSNSAIARACGVTETAVRKWLISLQIQREEGDRCRAVDVPEGELAAAKSRATSLVTTHRLTKEHVGRTISRIGESAGVVVQREDERTGQRKKFASAHDLRRGCAQRLINCGVSAETLKVIMRHKDFATTEKHYGAMRSAQSAAAEVHARLSAKATNDAFVGGYMGGHEKAPQLDAEELAKLKQFLNTL